MARVEKGAKKPARKKAATAPIPVLGAPGPNKKPAPAGLLAKAWKPGQSGNPKGRPVGARQKLTDTFIKDLSEFYAREGAALINRVAEQDPVALLHIIARFIPKETALTINSNVCLDPTQMQRIAEAWIVAQVDVEALESDYVIESADESQQAALPEPEAIEPPPGRVIDSPTIRQKVKTRRPDIDSEIDGVT